MRNPTPLPASLDPGGFLVKDAYAEGVPRWRLQTGDLITPQQEPTSAKNRGARP